ncbi:hypothetical protein EV674_107107 [Simplicispira metamorpha]|uniref:Uncharacterized protein n=1 Tax=Simplicispira metamorpha TaxID=80881 RepID=A0A4R2ND96_9BURK|nr:hypothetical protein EV674_107107 [Simplicispira metamorpha]
MLPQLKAAAPRSVVVVTAQTVVQNSEFVPL